MKFYLFATDTCTRCNVLKDIFDLLGLDYQYVDAIGDDTQDLCNEHNVELLPHVKVIADDGKVLYEAVGSDVDVKKVTSIIEKEKPKKER